jgi:hypothetical protein
MILFYDHSGPRLEYIPPQRKQPLPIHGILKVEDLNPQIKAEWRISRGELFKIGLRCLVAVFSR